MDCNKKLNMGLFLKLFSCFLKILSLFSKYYILSAPTVIKVFYMYSVSSWGTELFCSIISHPFTLLALIESVSSDFFLFVWNHEEVKLLKDVIAANPNVSTEQLQKMKPEISEAALNKAITSYSQIILPQIGIWVVFGVLLFLGKP